MLAGIISNLEGDKIINMLLTLWISVLAVLRKKNISAGGFGDFNAPC